MPVNVLVLIGDDQGREQLRPYGTLASAPKLLSIERLCAGGVRFGRFWSMPACSMTRAALETGRYSFHTGIGGLVESTQQPVLPLEVLLPRGLKRATGNAYACGKFGKHHISTSANRRGKHPIDCGWDIYQGSLRNLERASESYYSWNRQDWRMQDGEVVGSVKRCNVWAPTQNVNDALAWINVQSGPWLAWVAFNTPHTPYMRPPAGTYDETAYVLPTLDSPGGASDFAYFKAMQQSMDFEIGRLRAGMLPSVWANTVVIYLADNGTTANVVEPPFDPAHAKGTCYELGVGCPLIVSGPGVSLPGRSSAELVHAVDLYKTVVELCQGDFSLCQTLTPFDGVSFGNVLASATAPSLRTTMYTETFTPNGANLNAATAGQRAIMNNAGYKLLTFATGVSFPQLGGAGVGAELYNLNVSPNETANLLSNGDPAALTGADASNYAALVASYQTLLST